MNATPERPAAAIAEDAEFGSRHSRASAAAVAVIATAWSLFQLSLPQFVMLASHYVRAIHLAFAISLVYLSFPALKRLRGTGRLSFLSAKQRLPALDVLLAILAGAAAAYYALDYEGIGARQGAPVPGDLAVGIVLIVLLLEAARRALGWAMTAVAGLFIAYGLFAEQMPELLAFRSVSPARMVGQLTLSTEGIYGVPLGVSASTVYLFVLLGAML